MTGLTALVVGGDDHDADDLCGVLDDSGMSTARATFETGFDVSRSLPAPPDMVLVSADCRVAEVLSLEARFRGSGSSPTIVVYASSDFNVLEPHVRAGLDYIIPPFLPALVRGRLAACAERQELRRTRDEVANAAHLLKYERELQIAREIQQGFLPNSLPSPPGWQIEARFRPAREVAGDFYDGFELVNRRRIGFVVADVCDKGVGAALFMALIRTLIRHTAEHHSQTSFLKTDSGFFGEDQFSTPGDPPTRFTLPSIGSNPLANAVSRTSDYLVRTHLEQGYFATIFFGVLDPVSGALIYINGGHNPPVLISAGAERRLLTPTGPAVGIFADSAFAIGAAQLGVGDVLFAYTDGVTDAKNEEGHLFSEQRMLSLLDEPVDSADALLDRIDADLRRHVGTADQYDDITMMVLRRQASPHHGDGRRNGAVASRPVRPWPGDAGNVG